jgi:hypothetical protein
LRPLVPTTCDEIDQAVLVVMGRTDPTFFNRSVRAADVARTLSVTIAVEMRAATPEQLAVRHCLSEPGSARRLARRGRVLTSVSAWFWQLRESVLETIDRNANVRRAA